MFEIREDCIEPVASKMESDVRSLGTEDAINKYCQTISDENPAMMEILFGIIASISEDDETSFRYLHIVALVYQSMKASYESIELAQLIGE